MELIHKTDLEWLSLNYRKFRAGCMSQSKRRMILVMFEEDYQYFPTRREIRDGIIRAQIEQVETQYKHKGNEKILHILKWNYANTWQTLFDIA